MSLHPVLLSLAVLSLCLMSACASKSVSTPELPGASEALPEVPSKVGSPSTLAKKSKVPRSKSARELEILRQSYNIDEEAVFTALQMSRTLQNRGYKEKSFDTCKMGYGYPSANDCHQEYFASIYFRLACRDSEDTTSTPVTEEDMQPLSNRTIGWNLGKKSGNLQLDENGYGHIRVLSVSSPKNERLKISANGNFLYMRANQIKQIVAPKNWCN